MAFKIKTIGGEIVTFDEEKLRRSLTRPGASPDTIEDIIKKIEKNLSRFKTTENIYSFALDQLTQKEPHIATKYNLKRSLLEFGPTGYPFEKYIAQILQTQGYTTTVNEIVKGWCVNHEIDIIAKKNNESFMVECKFHNSLEYMTHVQVPLYTEARFHDIQKTWKPESPAHKLTHSWIFTNTKFTYEALKYGNCIGIQLTSWNYPKEKNLAQLIIKHKMYPITALTTLKRHQKKLFIESGLVLAKDIKKNSNLLKKGGLKPSEISKLIDQCTLLCGKNTTDKNQNL